VAHSAPSLELQPVQAGALAALEPSSVSAHAQEVAAQLSRDAKSRNTLRAQQSALAYWAAWFEVRYGQKLALPVPVAVVLQFIADHARVRRSPGSEEFVLGMGEAADALLVQAGVKKEAGPPALATLEHRVTILSTAHRKWLARLQTPGGAAAVGNPCLDPRVRELLADLRRSYAARGAAAPQKKPPLTKELLQRVVDTCDDSPIGVRDRAILLVAFASGGRRRAEVAAMQLQHLTRAQQGFLYYLPHSKTNQLGADDPTNWKPIMGRAAQALEAWLSVMQRQGIELQEGAIFRKAYKGTTIGSTGVGGSMIWKMVKARCKQAGLDEGFSPHSLRSGFMTQAGRDKVPLNEAMAMSGHSHVKTAMGYTHAGALQLSHAARLLDVDCDDHDR